MGGDLGRDEHADPTTELGQHAAQALAVLATLAEATARVAVEETRRRERREDRDARGREALGWLAERDDALGRRAAQAQAHAYQRQQAYADRRILARAGDDAWLAGARLRELAMVWRAARARAGQFAEAPGVIRRVERQLRRGYPRLMGVYDAAVRDGADPATAMRTAVAAYLRPAGPWPHGGRRSPALSPGEPAVDPELFAQACTSEQIRLATGVDVDAYVEQLHRLGAGGDAAASALRQALAARAVRALQQASADAATPDDPTTPAADEHTTLGRPRQSRALGEASDQATAASAHPDAAGDRSAVVLAGRWYPAGLDHPGTAATPPVTKRPAAPARGAVPAARRTR